MDMAFKLSRTSWFPLSRKHLLQDTSVCNDDKPSSPSSSSFARFRRHQPRADVKTSGLIANVEGRLGRSGGAGVLERPGLDQSQLSPEPRVEEGGEMGKLTQKRSFGGGDRYRVLLLDHEKHSESQVASVLPKVVPSLTVDEARKCFQVSREKGVGIVTVTVKEHAEFYAQMMARCGLRSGIEPDADII